MCTCMRIFLIVRKKEKKKKLKKDHIIHREKAQPDMIQGTHNIRYKVKDREQG